jgi:AAA domain
MSDNDQFARCMAPVAERVLGDAGLKPNKKLSSATEQRYGTNGSLSVDLTKGVYADHEDASGGGVLDLLRAFKGLDKAEAVKWLVDGGFIQEKEQEGKPSAANKAGKFMGFMEHHPVAIFKYQDRKGGLAYEVLKFPKEASRRYMQRRPLDGGWVWGLQAGEYGRFKNQKEWWKADPEKIKAGKYEEVRSFEEAERFLYQFAEVKKAIKDGVTVYLLEGEKDCETLREWGFVATTNAGGAKYWSDKFYDDLKGANLVIMPDNDDAGRTRVLLRGSGLKGRAASVKVLDLALHWQDMPEKKDVTDWKEMAGGTKERLAELAAHAPAWKPETPKSKFNAVYWHEVGAKGAKTDWLIDAVLSIDGKTMMAGESQAGKSFLAIEMAMSVATGKDFFARKVKHRGVVYQIGEGAGGMDKRVMAYMQHHGLTRDDDVPFVMLKKRIDLHSKEGDTASLIEEINAHKLMMSVPLGLVVIDTLATASEGADENSGKDMSVVLANATRIEEECGVHVMIIHHLNAGGSKVRGHTSLHGNVDQVLLVTNDEATKIKTLHMRKLKDDESGKKQNFTLTQVKLGYDPETERDITSCVVTTISEKEQLKKERAAQGYSPNEAGRRIMFNMFKAADRHGHLVVSHLDGPRAAIGHTVVKYEDYRNICLENMPEEEDRKVAMKRIYASFTRAKDDLVNAGVLGLSAPYMWWTGKPVRGIWRTFPADQRPEKYHSEAAQMHIENVSPAVQELIDNPELEAPF